MDREEKNKLAQIVSFELCPNRKYCITNYGEKANCYSDNNFAECSTIMKVVDNLINHETDLLKEFVGFVEDRLTIWIKDENYQANIAEAENDNLRKNMSLLMAETIEVIKNSMKPALKKFLEERK